MWQRVQTLYFFLSAALLAVAMCSTVALDVQAGESLEFAQRVPYAVLGALGLAANLVALFSFKRRHLQIRLAGFGAVVLLGLQVWLAVDFFSFKEYVFRWVAILPLVCVYFDIMAIRGIFADELLVKSSSRLRSAKNKKK